MAANPLRKPDYDAPTEEPRETPSRPEWPMEESPTGTSAPFGWAGYLIGAAVLVLALAAVLYFGISGTPSNTSTETTAPSGPVQTIPKQVTPPNASGQQNQTPGGSTATPQTTQPQNTAPQPGTNNP